MISQLLSQIKMISFYVSIEAAYGLPHVVDSRCIRCESVSVWVKYGTVFLRRLEF